MLIMLSYSIRPEKAPKATTRMGKEVELRLENATEEDLKFFLSSLEGPTSWFAIMQSLKRDGFSVWESQSTNYYSTTHSLESTSCDQIKSPMTEDCRWTLRVNDVASDGNTSS